MSRQKRPDSYSIIQQNIGERCQWVLDEVNPNQSDLARDLEVDQSTINKYLKGTRAQSVFFIRNFAKKFKLSTDYLLRGAFVGIEERSLSLRLAANILNFGLSLVTLEQPRIYLNPRQKRPGQ